MFFKQFFPSVFFFSALLCSALSANLDVLKWNLQDEEQREEVGAGVKRGAFDSPVMAPSKVNAEEIQDILQLHNAERSLPQGNDMMALTWDDDLANLAQGLSDHCVWGHDNLNLPGGERIGQNIAMSSNQNADLGYLVKLWINEKHDYTISSGACNAGKVCGHYTQMVWSDTTKVGCGATKCPGMGRFLVCDYQKAGNWQGKKAVHLGGEPCSQCNLYPGTNCDDGLCSVCDPKTSSSCRPYDASQCIDAKVDPGVGNCGWVTSYCSQSQYRSWLEASCAKTCGYCKS